MKYLLVIFFTLNCYAQVSFQISLELLKDYCHEIDFQKVEGASYFCRVEVERDCMKSLNPKACPLLVDLRKLEVKWYEEGTPEKLKGKKKKRVAFRPDKPKLRPVILPPSLRKPAQSISSEKQLSVTVGSPNLTLIPDEVLIKNGNLKESIPEIRKLHSQIRDLRFELNSVKLPVNCQEDSHCQVQGIGRKPCGGYVSSITYSNIYGVPSAIQDILRLNEMDRKLQKSLVGWYSTCDVYLFPNPRCIEQICQ